ncbi:MAG: hypothetical protein K2Q11_09860 [Burkholderiaceae bacterium]|nr:hypothetical protein [Burkholderiaceae bacterium]
MFDHLGPSLTQGIRGLNVTGVLTLRAMSGLVSPGVWLDGAGFLVTPEEAAALLTPLLDTTDMAAFTAMPVQSSVIRPCYSAIDLNDKPQDLMVIDAFGLDAQELLQRHPMVYQWLQERVQPERDAKQSDPQNTDHAQHWWLLGQPRPHMRQQLAALPRYIATVTTTRRRFFQFLDASIVPDHQLTVIALDTAFALGVLSSQVHSQWVLATAHDGGEAQGRAYYHPERSFETFPFPGEDTGLTPALHDTIALCAQKIDDHRRHLLLHSPSVTTVGLYNVLAALRAGRALRPKEKVLHIKGLVSVLWSLHQALDAAVLAAYGLSADACPEAVLARLVQLNAARASEEAQGYVRWLRPEFQQKLTF